MLRLIETLYGFYNNTIYNVMISESEFIVIEIRYIIIQL